jgi:DNA primase
MCCPLPGHDDRSPSFKFVGAEEMGFVCYGCGVKGGVFALVVALGLAPDRAEAARFLEERA